jgi:Thioredoxin
MIEYAWVIVIILILLTFWPCPCGCGCRGFHAIKCTCKRVLMTVTPAPLADPPKQHYDVQLRITQPQTIVADPQWPWRVPSTTGQRTAHVEVTADLVTEDPTDQPEQKEGFESFPLNVPTQRINDTRRVYLHSVSWCGYCKAFKPMWEQLKSQNPDVAFEEIDGDVTKDPLVTSYPTIIMLDERGQRHVYTAQRTISQLTEWIRAAQLP